MKEEIRSLTAERDEAQAEIDRLTAENKRLKQFAIEAVMWALFWFAIALSLALPFLLQE